MMHFNTPLFIAFRYWRSKSGDRFGRLVTNLATLGIVLGVMALIIVLSVMNGLENTQKRNVLSALPHAIVAPSEYHWPLSETLVLPPYVNKAVPINRANVIIQSHDGINAGQLIGVTDNKDDPLLADVPNVAERLPENGFNVLVGTILADQLNLSVGDKIRLMITENSQYTPFGRVPVQRLFTVTGFYPEEMHKQSNGFTLFANLTDVGRLMRIPTDQTQGMRLFLNDPFQVTELASFFPQENWKINDWREQKGEFFQAVRMEKNMMSLLISLIIIVAISNIVTSLSLMVVDKQGEIAILQTQGLTKGQVTQIFISQGAIVGIIGALLGGLLGILATNYLGEVISLINPHGVSLPTEIDYEQVGIIVLSSIMLSLACTIYPAYRASKIEPAKALRYE